MIKLIVYSTLCLIVIFFIAKLTVEMVIRLIDKIKSGVTKWKLTPSSFAVDDTRSFKIGMILQIHSENCKIIVTDIDHENNTITVEHYDGNIKNKVK